MTNTAAAQIHAMQTEAWGQQPRCGTSPHRCVRVALKYQDASGRLVSKDESEGITFLHTRQVRHCSTPHELLGCRHYARIAVTLSSEQHGSMHQVPVPKPANSRVCRLKVARLTSRPLSSDTITSTSAATSKSPRARRNNSPSRFRPTRAAAASMAVSTALRQAHQGSAWQIWAATTQQSQQLRMRTARSTSSQQAQVSSSPLIRKVWIPLQPVPLVARRVIHQGSPRNALLHELRNGAQ